MIRIQHGHGGWVNRHTSGAVVAAAILAVFAALSGCSSKKSTTETGKETLGTTGNEGVGETSLEKMQKGTLGGAVGGPLSDIHFDYDEFTIKPQDSQILKANASWLSGHPGTRVQVEGHCDSRGSEEYNIALGAKRAQAAKEYLTTLGVSGDRVSTISYGKELPLCSEETESCWSRNRRDHFVVNQ